MIAAAEKAFGRLDILFNNAGIMLDGDDDAVHTSEAIWEKTLAINLKGVFLGCKFGIPALSRPGGGRSSTRPRSSPLWAQPRRKSPTRPAKGACWR